MSYKADGLHLSACTAVTRLRQAVSSRMVSWSQCSARAAFGRLARPRIRAHARRSDASKPHPLRYRLFTSEFVSDLDRRRALL